MKPPYRVVQFTSHTAEGDTMHRRTWPMQALGGLPDFHVIDVDALSPYRYRLALEADLLVLSMTMDAELVPILRWRRAKGKPTVFEVNDYVFGVAPWNRIFDRWNSPMVQAMCVHMMAIADVVQVSNSFLAEAFKPYASRLAVFPNQLATVPSSFPRKAERPLVVGWGGSAPHFVDVAGIAPAVSKWIMKHDDVVLSIMGDEAIANLFRIPTEKKQFVPWDTMEAYEEYLKGVHIGLAPLRDTPYNRGRSDVKWLEYAAAGCVFVGQQLPVYAESVEDGKTGFLFRDAHELVGILERLHGNRSVMESVRHAAFDYVTTQRRYGDHIQERADVYTALLQQEPPPGGEKWNLDELARFPQMDLPKPLPGYFPVELDAEEGRALQELYYRLPNISESSINLIEQKYGEFHLTGYCRAVLAFVRGDLSAAAQHLRRSIYHYPAAVESLRLLGEVLLAMRESGEAREMLSVATQWNRAYAPTYRYLVLAMEQESDWNAAIAATEEWEKHCNEDPFARVRRGVILIRAGQQQKGIDTIVQGMIRVKDRFADWQVPFAGELVVMLREVDELMSEDPQWTDFILTAADMFPHSMWLASRAGAICFTKGDYKRGTRILNAARSRLLDAEWQMLEGVGGVQEYRGVIEARRTACEEIEE